MTQRVPFLDVSATYTELAGEIDTAIARVLRSGQFVLGENVRSFETEWAAHVGARHCVAVGNGLDALKLSLMALGVSVGDEVIVPSNTFIATWLAVSAVGATPVPVEPVEATGNLDSERVRRAITVRTRAIVPVHLYGHPADVDALTSLGVTCGIPIVFDAAQAHGASYRSRPVGSYGSASTWSFYPGKNLGAFGDGGAITTDDEALAEKLLALRNYGSKQRYRHDVLGTNSRLDELQAAVLRVKMRRLADWNRRRTHIADEYAERLSGLPVRLVEPLPATTSSWHLYTIRILDRDALSSHLAQEGVESLIHYPVPPHLSGAYRARYGSNPLPIADRIAVETLSLPIGPHLTDGQVDRVCTAVESAFRT